MASPAPAAMPSEEFIERCREILNWHKTGVLSGGALRAYASATSTFPDREEERLTQAERATERQALETVVAFASILAEKERLGQKVRELALLLDRQMGTPCEQIRHHHAYADLTAIAEKRQDEADQQAARADAAEARALAAESALAAERERCAKVAEQFSNVGPGDVCEVQAAEWQYGIAAAIRAKEPK